MISVRIVAIAFFGLLVQGGTAWTEDAPPAKATATRPAKEPAGQSSLPSNAPPATATQPTASTNQSPTVREMNEDAKRKLETEGK